MVDGDNIRVKLGIDDALNVWPSGASQTVRLRLGATAIPEPPSSSALVAISMLFVLFFRSRRFRRTICRIASRQYLVHSSPAQVGAKPLAGFRAYFNHPLIRRESLRE